MVRRVIPITRAFRFTLFKREHILITMARMDSGRRFRF